MSESTAVANWDEELAAAAAAAAAQEASTSSGQFFGLRAGVLTFNDAPLPNNEMAVIILDAVLENVFYGGAYDPDTPQSPVCFAFGRDEKTMEPHANVDSEEGFDRQHQSCHGCPNNEFGSADVGKGKACRNTRRLAMISAGTLERIGRSDSTTFTAFEDVEHFETSPIGFMKLPVMSVKGYAAFVKQVAGALQRPPHAIFTKVRVVPDAKSQFRVLFEPIGQVPNELLGAVMARHREATESIEFPYTPRSDDFEQAKPAPKRGGKAAPPARGKKY
jgi:hypothetical protein